MNGKGQYSIMPRPDEAFVVVETRFDSGMKQCFDLSELAGMSPALANFVYTHAINGQGVWSIAESDIALEVVVLTDGEGKHRELCANMLEQVTD